MNYNDTCGCVPSPVMKNPLSARAEESVNDILIDIEDIIPEIERISDVIKGKIKDQEPCECCENSGRSDSLIPRMRKVRAQLRAICGTLSEANASL
jgi:hypothetical protein